MTEVRTRRGGRLSSLAVDCVLLAGLLLVTVGHSGVPVAPALVANAALRPSANASGADLTVDPSSFGLQTGANVSLGAVWSVGSPLCRLTPLWYRWSVVDDGNATGFLNATSGPTSTFTADSFDSGTVTVAVRSGTELGCGANESVLERTGGANISIVVPLHLSGIELGANPLLPGGTTTLEGNITGGAPPYTLYVTWGDGTHSTVAQTSAGPFTIGHRFSAGEFVPYVLASDTDGNFANVSVPEALSVGTDLEVAIAPASYVAEVGIPVQFTGVVEDGSVGTVTLFDCSNTTVGSAVRAAAVSNETSFSCTFTSPGTAEVLFGAFPPQPGGPSASAVLYEHVVLPPQVSAEPVERVGEVGGTALVQVHLSGGVPPISLTWNLSGDDRSGGAETVAFDGGGVLTIPLGAAGEYAVGVVADDFLGSIDTNDTATLQVDPQLIANASDAGSLLPYSAVAEVGGEVLSGCPPFSWWVVPDLGPANGSAGNGTLGNVGGFTWNGSYAREGNLSITVGVADGCGATWQTNLEIPLIPPLSVEVAAAPGPTSANETLAVNLSIQGGLPPFRLDVNASDNESWNRSISSDGTYHWLVPTDANGSLGVTVSVADCLGRSIETNLTVFLIRPTDPTVPPPPVPSPPPSLEPGPTSNSTAPSTIDSIWPLAVLVPTAGGATVMFLWRRHARRAHHEVPGPDPVATLRHIIEPAEGAERFTVELLAEEAGIPLAVVRTTIDRLVSEGAVRSESGADGEEVLSWSSETGR